MREVLLHHIWQFQVFNTKTLFTEQGELLRVMHPGHYLKQTGPDFFLAKLFIGEQEWAGNVEIHIKASDWYAHGHENDRNYDNVVLHVVWESDIPVLRKDGSLMAVLVLKDYVDESLLDRYNQLFEKRKWIYCEDQIPEIPPLKILNWKERLYVERLETKSEGILALLSQCSNDWRQLFFICLARGFGLNVNGEAFEKMAKQLSVKVLEKQADNLKALEAILLGSAGLLQREVEDVYGISLQKEWGYFKALYDLEELETSYVQFYKLRPDNFPTIRLSQLAALYHQQKDILKDVLEAKNLDDFYELFTVVASSFWDTHYVFDKENSRVKKKTSKRFIDLLLLNVVVPFLYVYYKHKDRDFSEELFAIVRGLKPEQNTIITNFEKLGFVVEDALDSQAMLHLKKNYCNNQACLNCLIGRAIVYN